MTMFQNLSMYSNKIIVKFFHVVCNVTDEVQKSFTKQIQIFRDSVTGLDKLIVYADCNETME